MNAVLKLSLCLFVFVFITFQTLICYNQLQHHLLYGYEVQIHFCWAINNTPLGCSRFRSGGTVPLMGKKTKRLFADYNTCITEYIDAHIFTWRSIYVLTPTVQCNCNFTFIFLTFVILLLLCTSQYDFSLSQWSIMGKIVLNRRKIEFTDNLCS